MSAKMMMRKSKSALDTLQKLLQCSLCHGSPLESDGGGCGLRLSRCHHVLCHVCSPKEADVGGPCPVCGTQNDVKDRKPNRDRGDMWAEVEAIRSSVEVLTKLRVAEKEKKTQTVLTAKENVVPNHDDCKGSQGEVEMLGGEENHSKALHIQDGKVGDCGNNAEDETSVAHEIGGVPAPNANGRRGKKRKKDTTHPTAQSLASSTVSGPLISNETSGHIDHEEQTAQRNDTGIESGKVGDRNDKEDVLEKGQPSRRLRNKRTSRKRYHDDTEDGNEKGHAMNDGEINERNGLQNKRAFKQNSYKRMQSNIAKDNGAHAVVGNVGHCNIGNDGDHANVVTKKSIGEECKVDSEKPNLINPDEKQDVRLQTSKNGKKPIKRTKMRKQKAKEEQTTTKVARKQRPSFASPSGKGSASTAPAQVTIATRTPSRGSRTALATTPSTPNGWVHKRNAKGETPLHVACVKGQLTKVRSLLDEHGATVNTRDHNGWTPLHEAANLGNGELVQLLLEAENGCLLLDVPGGDEMATALHDAAESGHFEVARILIEAGADKEARNKQGLTPLEISKNDRTRSVIEDTESKRPAIDLDSTLNTSCSTTVMKSSDRINIFTVSSNVSSLLKKLEKTKPEMNFKILATMKDEMTHYVASCEGSVLFQHEEEEQIAYCRAVLMSKLIVNVTWLKDSLLEGKFLDEDEYLVLGPPSKPTGAQTLSRSNLVKQRPPLFANCRIFLQGAFNNKPEIEALVKTGGATLLSRAPDPESIESNIGLGKREGKRRGKSGTDKLLVEEQEMLVHSSGSVPYHADPEGPLARCSHFLIYELQKPQLCYNMAHVKSLPLAWLLASIHEFTLVNPASVLSD